MNKKFYTEQVYGNKYVKTTIKYYDSKCKTKFHYKEIPPKDETECICLSIVLPDSAFESDKNYYPHTILEEFKYIAKQVTLYINDKRI